MNELKQNQSIIAMRTKYARYALRFKWQKNLIDFFPQIPIMDQGML